MENEELEKLKHDLRGPLTIVQNFFDELELLQPAVQMTESQYELLLLAKRALEKSFFFFFDVWKHVL